MTLIVAIDALIKKGLKQPPWLPYCRLQYRGVAIDALIKKGLKPHLASFLIYNLEPEVSRLMP